MGRQRTLLVVEAALSIALAAVLGMWKIVEMPQGGSVSLGMLPILVFALRRGPRWGLGAGLAYGLVDILISPFPPVHPAQFFLDYPLAWMVVGLAGVAATARLRGGAFASAMAVGGGVVLGALARYACHVASGVVFFAAYAPEGQPVLAYSLLYNTYVLVSATACLVVALVLLPALERAVPVRRADATEA